LSHYKSGIFDELPHEVDIFLLFAQDFYAQLLIEFVANEAQMRIILGMIVIAHKPSSVIELA
jgi:hypothetical protein